MVGPGTGVAPFRAYSWQQHTHKTDRDLVLFFGCRGRAKDFYFKVGSGDNSKAPHNETVI